MDGIMKRDKLFKQPEQPLVTATRFTNEADRIKYLEGVKANPLMFYCPNGANENLIKTFADSVSESKAPTIFVTCANGIGKTTSTFHIICNIVNKPQNGWFDYPIFWNFPFPKLIWYCTRPNMLVNKMKELSDMLKVQEEDIRYNETENILDRQEIETRKLGKTYISEIYKNGFTVRGYSYKQNPEEYEGENVGLIIDDEPPPEQIYKRQKWRKRMGGILLVIMTAIDIESYVIDEIEKCSKKNKSGRKTHYYVTADLYEACQKRGVRGHLDPDIVDDMVEDCDEDEKDARVYGKVGYSSAYIYPEFSPEIHCVTPTAKGFEIAGKEYEIPAGSILKMVNDPKDGKSDAVIWGWVFPNGRKFIVAEYPFEKKQHYWNMKKSVSVDEMVKDWWRLETNRGWKVSRRIMDRRFGWQSRGFKNEQQRYLYQIYMSSAAQLSEEVGDPSINFDFIKSYSSSHPEGEVAYRHKIVKQHLAIQPDGLPNLLIANTLFHTQDGLKNYKRKLEMGVRGEMVALTDTVIIPKYTDFADVVGYFCCDGLSAEKPKKKNNWKRRKGDEGYNIFSTF